MKARWKTRGLGVPGSRGAGSRGTGSRGVENAGSGGKRGAWWKTRGLMWKTRGTTIFGQNMHFPH